jgi:hypothetical protein
MKLDKLIADLLAIREDLESEGVDISEIEVLAGIQPSYPLTTIVMGAVSGEELSDHVDGGLDGHERHSVWLSTVQPGSSSVYNPYAPKALWDVAR